MRKEVPERLEAGRIREGMVRSDPSWGLSGYFLVQGPCGQILKIVASDAELPEAEGWEHVSVSLKNRCPNWQEMSFVKDLFWDKEECVIQYHPPESQYISNHPYVLHMWKNTQFEFPMPPSIMVGIKAAGELKTPEDARRMWLQLGKV